MNPSAKKLTGVQYVESVPSKLLTASELSEQLIERGMQIKPERLIELAEAFYIPHYRVDGGPPLFSFSEARKWVYKNLTQRIDGDSLPVDYRILIHTAPGTRPDTVPTALQMIADKLISQTSVGAVAGVYFLCEGDKVRYVGQSVCAGARIGSHAGSKKFDRAFVLPVPVSQLDAVEGAFIRALDPEDNRGAPAQYVSDNDTLHIFGAENLKHTAMDSSADLPSQEAK